MPDAEIHADFDRDGKLSLTASEYAARATGHGAILGANVDRDGRSLPAVPKAERPVTLDHAMPTKTGGDTDPIAIQINISPDAAANFIALSLRIRGDNAEAVALIDDKARVVRATSSSRNSVVFTLPRKAGKHKFKLEAKRVPGSPLGSLSGALEIEVVGHDGARGEPILDTGRFLLAPFLVLDEVSPAERLYLCETPDNVPSVKDVTEAMAGTGATLHLIAAADNSNDAWIQDQFQFGYIATPGRTMRTVLHLPRLRRNATIDRSKQNLAGVVTTHFPSSNLGLIDDFWQRQLIVRHLGGSTSIPFPASVELFELLHRAIVAENFFRDTIDIFCAKARTLGISPAPPECGRIPQPQLTFPAIRQQLPELLRIVKSLTNQLITKMGTTSSEADVARGRLAHAQQAMDDLDIVFRVTNRDRFEITVSTGTFAMDDQQLVALNADLSKLHNSLNFGGNIEASPPLFSHPFGKVVIGSSGDREVDPALFDLFDAASAVQPIVEIDTSWLDVAHVDEVMTFLPDQVEKTHVILRASPEVAQALIDEIRAVYLSGLNEFQGVEFESPWKPPFSRHSMRLGTHPVTRMFRGKYWLHSHPAPGKGGASSEPPAIYRRIVKHYEGEWTGQFAPYISEHPDYDEHQYRAALTTFELHAFSGLTNQEIVDQKLDVLERKLRDEFTEFAILKAPVFFDFAQIVGIDSTSAFTPNLVNLQNVNGTVLIPNPFGPRMLPDDAMAVIKKVLEDRNLGNVAKSVSKTFFTSQKLDVVKIWLLGLDHYGGIEDPISNLTEVTAEFIDGFPQTIKRTDIEKMIKTANPGAFDFGGRLNKGWRKITIPEKTVDVFQAYTHALLMSLGLKVRWVDTWFYHVRFGEIHCGTNVLRKVSKVRTPWWTRVPSPDRAP